MLGLLVVLLILTNLRLPFTHRIKDSLSDGFIPFLEFSSRLQAKTRFLIDRVKAYGDLQVENSSLQKELAELTARVAQVGDLERENREFRSMLNFKDRSELKLLPAKVISRDPSNWYSSILIDRGLNDGINTNMPVLTVNGLVGKTIEVTEHNARIILLVDENCKVSGWMRESGQYGIVQGNMLSGTADGLCRMTFVDRSAQVKSNDKVFTSGLGEIFPKGIFIGTVSSVTSSDMATKHGGLYQEVNINPAVDLRRIDEVFVGVGVKALEKQKANKAAKEKKDS